MARDPVASSPDSSSCTRWTSVATSQSASRAIVWPTARVRLTAMSKSMTPASTSRSSVETASASAWVKARSLPRSGKPSARHSRRACSMVAPVSSATSRALKTMSSPRIACSRSDGSSGGRSPASVPGSLGGRPRQASSSSPSRCVEATEQVHQLALHVLDVGDVVAARTEPWVLASLITRVPQPSIRSIGPMS